MYGNKLLFVFLVFIFSSCKELFQYNPNEVRVDAANKNLNEKNIQKLIAAAVPDTVKFILIGDSQRFYNELDDFVEIANTLKGIQFVVLAGDISDFGLNKEFDWIARSLKKLQVPFISVIGNHDMLANGRLVYKEMFGAEDFTFRVGPNKFICLNTNSLEVGFNGSLPNLTWLQQQLSDTATYSNAFVISHIPPFDGGFDDKLEQPYAAVLATNQKVRLSLHGHQHRFSRSIPYNDGKEYIIVGSQNKRNYVLVSVWNDQYKAEEFYY